ncbi:MAG TPA: SGNH/GDSL hydrolase family protein [Steroidobacteraceae bacterium]|nr:SGNH/GDSL hydrolase family protein [Steroidobacteraceae bacterium]
MKRSFGSVRRLSAVLLAVSALGCTAAQAGSLYVFGDSLSDAGNNAIFLRPQHLSPSVVDGDTYVPDGPYKTGVYSNGPVWINYMAERLQDYEAAMPSRLWGGHDFAYGGARLEKELSGNDYRPSIRTQVQTLLDQHVRIRPDDLFIVAGGGNDVRDTVLDAAAILLDPHSTDPLDVRYARAGQLIQQRAYAFGASLSGVVAMLRGAGARQILVWDLPDVGLTPYARATGSSDLATQVSLAFNQAVAGYVAPIPGVTVFDVYGLIDGIVADPDDYRLTNVEHASGNPAMHLDPDKSLFWDGIHPTTAGHRIVAETVLDAWDDVLDKVYGRERDHDGFGHGHDDCGPSPFPGLHGPHGVGTH